MNHEQLRAAARQICEGIAAMHQHDGDSWQPRSRWAQDAGSPRKCLVPMSFVARGLAPNQS